MTALEQRTAPRRLINLGAHLRGAKADPVDVRVIDLSPEGCRITPGGALAAGDQAWLKLTGIEAIGCSVVWTDGTDAGCAFHRTLNETEVEIARRPERSPTLGLRTFGTKDARRRG